MRGTPAYPAFPPGPAPCSCLTQGPGWPRAKAGPSPTRIWAGISVTPDALDVGAHCGGLSGGVPLQGWQSWLVTALQQAPLTAFPSPVSAHRGRRAAHQPLQRDRLWARGPIPGAEGERRLWRWWLSPAITLHLTSCCKVGSCSGCDRGAQQCLAEHHCWCGGHRLSPPRSGPGRLWRSGMGEGRRERRCDQSPIPGCWHLL